MPENNFYIEIDFESIEETKDFLDFISMLENNFPDPKIVDWFEARSKKASDLLRSPCKTGAHREYLLEGLHKVPTGFDLAWQLEHQMDRGEQYWHAEWCKTLAEVIFPNAGITIDCDRNWYRATLSYMHDSQAPITGIFLMRLFELANYNVCDLKFTMDDEDGD